LVELDIMVKIIVDGKSSVKENGEKEKRCEK